MTAQYWVYFLMAVSALSLVAAFSFERTKTLLRRQYKTVAALLAPAAPAFAGAQEAAGGEASLKLPDLSTVHLFRHDRA